MTMIRNETEYRETLRRLAEQDEHIKLQTEQLRQMELSKDEIKRVLDPVRCFREQLKEEVAIYEGLKRGEFSDVQNFSGLGPLLIALRIASGITQRELAERLEVNESQVSRDERNEYRGITVERASRILEVLGAKLKTTVVSVAKSARRKQAASSRTA